MINMLGGKIKRWPHHTCKNNFPRHKNQKDNAWLHHTVDQSRKQLWFIAWRTTDHSYYTQVIFHITLKQNQLFGQTCWTVGESEPGPPTVWENIHHNCQPCSGSWSQEIWLGSRASVPPGHTSLQQGETVPHWWEIKWETLLRWGLSKTDRKMRECDINMTTNYSRYI